MGLRNFILTNSFGYLGRKLDTYKTKIGGGGFIALGIVYLLPMMFSDLTTQGFPKGDVEKGIQFVALGFATLGIGHKVQKNTDAIAKDTIESLPTEIAKKQDEGLVEKTTKVAD